MNGFQEFGYVYLKNFGITPTDLKKYVDVSNIFFDLPEEFKLKFKRNYNTLHGYSNEFHET